MSRHFTHYWTNDTWRHNQERVAAEELLDFTSSGVFTRRGVGAGDYVFVVTVLSGRLYLCGRLLVARVVSVREAARATGWPPDELDEFPEHVLASYATPMRFDRAVPLGLTARLRMRNGRGLTFDEPGVLNSQTLRGVRELSPESAAALDGLLPGLRAVIFPGGQT